MVIIPVLIYCSDYHVFRLMRVWPYDFVPILELEVYPNCCECVDWQPGAAGNRQLDQVEPLAMEAK